MDQYTLFVLLAPIGCAITSTVVYFCWQNRTVRMARPLAVCMIGSTAYLFFNTLELVDPTAKGTLFFAQVCYIFLAALVLSWLGFALVFSNREALLHKPIFLLLGIIPITAIILVFTNSYHHLIWREYTFLPVSNGYLYMKVLAYGNFFWLYWLEMYAIIIVSAVLIVSSSISPRQNYRMQSRLSIAAALLPLGVNLIYVLHLIPGFNKDYSALGYAFSGCIMAVSIFRYRLLDLTPFARTILIDNMADGMITLDGTKRVVDYNPAAQRILASTASPTLQLGESLPWLESHLIQFETYPAMELLKSEIFLGQREENQYYDLQIRQLQKQKSSDVIGYLVVLHSIAEHKRLLQATRKLAEEDALTGVLNRTRFVELTSQEIEHASANSLDFTILMIDIDKFKEINDTAGHVCGDQVIQAFARRLQSLLRSSDLIGRIGGDEFIVLLPETSEEKGWQLASRLCAQVAACPMETATYGALPITISIGVAQGLANSHENLEQVIIRADQGLYQAKEQGRNCVCVGK